MLARPFESALAERELWSRRQRWLDEFRAGSRHDDAGRSRWRYTLTYLLKCLTVARVLRHFINFGTVAEQVLSATLPSSCTTCGTEEFVNEGPTQEEHDPTPPAVSARCLPLLTAAA